MASIQGAKAIGAVSRGDVEEIGHARVFAVKGSTGGRVYTVVVGFRPAAFDAAVDVCNCPAGEAGRRCYHVGAARLLLEKQRHAAQRAQELGEPTASCDGCGRRAWCRLVSWREGSRTVGKFLCDDCRAGVEAQELELLPTSDPESIVGQVQRGESAAQIGETRPGFGGRE